MNLQKHMNPAANPAAMTETQTQEQLDILRELNRIFTRIEGQFWLRGGWAIDFLLGEITRPHEDLDLVTWIDQREALEKSLLDAGYERFPVSGRQTDFKKGNVDIQFLYLTHSEDGQLIPNGLPEWVWRPDALQSERHHLGGMEIRVLSPEQLLEEKEVYEQIGRTPRPKDLNSKEVLKRIIARRQVR